MFKYLEIAGERERAWPWGVQGICQRWQGATDENGRAQVRKRSVDLHGYVPSAPELPPSDDSHQIPMNVAGRKVGPAEVEQALIEHPAVCEAAAIGVPDELTGEASGSGGPAIVVVVEEATPDELSAHLMATLGPTFRPREIRAVKELPKTQSGKMPRNERTSAPASTARIARGGGGKWGGVGVSC